MLCIPNDIDFHNLFTILLLYFVKKNQFVLLKIILSACALGYFSENAFIRVSYVFKTIIHDLFLYGTDFIVCLSSYTVYKI